MSTPTATRVGWCQDCEAYTLPPEPTCPGEDGIFVREDKHDYYQLDLFICRLPDHCDAMGFKTVDALLEHERE